MWKEDIMSGYDDMIEQYYEGRDILGPEDGDPEGYEGDVFMNAKEARELTKQNKEREEKIIELIKRGEDSIKSACEMGKRRSDIYAGYCINGRPQYPEVVEHFERLGYELKYVYGTNIYEIFW